jgi:hypothetical protein
MKRINIVFKKTHQLFVSERFKIVWLPFVIALLFSSLLLDEKQAPLNNGMDRAGTPFLTMSNYQNPFQHGFIRNNNLLNTVLYPHATSVKFNSSVLLLDSLKMEKKFAIKN